MNLTKLERLINNFLPESDQEAELEDILIEILKALKALEKR